MKSTAEGGTPIGDQGVTHPTSSGLTPEILAVIESAASMFVGKKVTIVSVALAPESSRKPNSWARQGRDIIHGSRDMVQRGH